MPPFSTFTLRVFSLTPCFSAPTPVPPTPLPPPPPHPLDGSTHPDSHLLSYHIQGDFARAAKIVSGQELSAECVWVVFKMFDSGGDGVLQYEELMNATRDRLRRLPGQRESLPVMTHFIECVRGK